MLVERIKYDKKIGKFWKFPILGFSIGMLILTSCGGSKTSETGEVTESEDPVAEKISIDITQARDMSGELTVAGEIIFDESSENFIGIPQQIAVRGDTIYAVDPAKSPGLYAYLSDGTQLFSYCSRGDGPEDLSSPFSLNVTDTEISVFDMMSKSIFFFSKDAKFLRKIPLSIDVCNAMVGGDGSLWVDYTNNQDSDTRLAWRNNGDSEEKTVLEVPELLKGMTIVEMRSFMPLEDGTINYKPAIEPNIYRLKDGEAKLKYELDFVGLWPDEATFRQEYTGNDWPRNIRKFPVLGINVVENDRWLIVGFENNSDRYCYISDKLKSEGVLYKDDKQRYYNPLTVVGDTLYIMTREDTLAKLKL